jgi:hypothetical protein
MGAAPAGGSSSFRPQAVAPSAAAPSPTFFRNSRRELFFEVMGFLLPEGSSLE